MYQLSLHQKDCYGDESMDVKKENPLLMCQPKLEGCSECL